MKSKRGAKLCCVFWVSMRFLLIKTITIGIVLLFVNQYWYILILIINNYKMSRKETQTDCCKRNDSICNVWLIIRKIYRRQGAYSVLNTLQLTILSRFLPIIWCNKISRGVTFIEATSLSRILSWIFPVLALPGYAC